MYVTRKGSQFLGLLALLSVNVYCESKGRALERLVAAKVRSQAQRNPSTPKPQLPPAPGANVISSNTGNGVLISFQSNGNLIQNNTIGLDVTDTIPLGNGQDGVRIQYNSDNNSVGGTSPETGNVIAYNKKGVVVGRNKCDISTGNSILSNSIFDNGCIGIDLADNGVTPNHKKSPTTGPNNFQNYPVIKKVEITGTSTQIRGTLQSVANSSFLIQFFSTPETGKKQNREGKTQIGQTTVTTDANGCVSFTVILGPVAADSSITSTATLVNPNAGPSDTSEFSAPVTACSKESRK